MLPVCALSPGSPDSNTAGGGREEWDGTRRRDEGGGYKRPDVLGAWTSVGVPLSTDTRRLVRDESDGVRFPGTECGSTGWVLRTTRYRTRKI